MATVTLLGTQVFNTTAGDKTVTATPAVNDLIVVVAATSGNVATTAVSDNNSSGTYTQIGSAVTDIASGMQLSMWVRDSLVGSGSSTVFTATQSGSSGGGLGVFKITGMSRTGSAAVRQEGGLSNQSASTTPTISLGAAVSTSNPVIGCVCRSANPVNVAQRSSPAYTEPFDVGWSAPNSGVEAMFISSGETASSIAWGGTVSGGYGVKVAELDSSASGTSETPTPGGAVAGGAAPTVKASTGQGGASAAGATPAPKTSVTIGGASAQGNAATVRVAVLQGGAVAGGFAPSEPAGPVSETPTPGGAVAGGFAPSAKVSVAAGGASAQGNPATVRVATTISGATAGGLAPTVRASTTIGGAVATGTTATVRVALTIGGGVAGGVGPSESIPGSDTPIPGGATAGGFSPAVTVSTVAGGATGGGFAASVRVPVTAGGGLAGGQLDDPSGVPPPGAVSIADTLVNAVVMVDADSGATAAQDDATAVATVTDGSEAILSADDGTGADVAIVDAAH